MIYVVADISETLERRERRRKKNLERVIKQSTRMIKMWCPECGYICRASRTKIVEIGAVLCPCNSKPMAHLEIKKRTKGSRI